LCVLAAVMIVLDGQACGPRGPVHTRPGRHVMGALEQWTGRRLIRDGVAMVLDQFQEGVHVTDQGRRIGWMLRGPAAGRGVVYLHGQPGSRREQLLLGDELLRRDDLRVLSIDRAGYGDTDPAGTDRREVARDALTVASAHRLSSFVAVGVSQGGIYALTVAALAPERVHRVVLVSGHVLPYDDDEVVAGLSEAEQADLSLLRAGPSPELDESYAGMAAAIAGDPVGAFAPLVVNWSRPEQAWFTRPDIQAVLVDDMRLAYRQGHRGQLDDGLRTVAALEIDLKSVTMPVRALHGSRDDLEPYANLERLASRLPDIQMVRFEGMSHFGPLAWPGLITAMIAADT